MENTDTKQAIQPIYNLLKWTFGIVPIVAGLDKFTLLLTDWTQYLDPGMVEMLPFPAEGFMMIIGVVEIVAGALVLARPAIGGSIVAAWLTLIALSLLVSGNFLDVAVRDLVMAVAALSFVKIGKVLS